MEIALFIFYLLLFAFIITKISFFSNSGIGPIRLIALFLIKILAAIGYGLFYKLPQYYAGSDTWRFYRLSLEETNWLLTDPKAFLKDLFVYGYSGAGNIFEGQNTYWNDLKSNVPVKLMAVINIFTHNSYYTNTIFFNFLFLFGLVALFKFLINLFPGKNSLVICGIFLLPSTLFWCSGIHKDGLILSATGICIYSYYSILVKGLSVKRLVALFFCSLLIFSLRNYIVFAFLPGAIAWGFSYKFPAAKFYIFTGIYLLCAVAFFMLPVVIPSANFLLFITQRQHEFFLLSGGSEVNFTPLQPTFESFVYFLPKALDMAFLRPHVNEIKSFSYLPAAAENLGVVILILLFVFTLPRYRFEMTFTS